MRSRVQLLIAVSILVCSFAVAASANAYTLYAPKYFSPADNIDAFNTAADGSLTELDGSPFLVGPPGVGGIGNVAFAPDGNRGVVCFYFNGGIQGLSVAASGAISPAQTTVGSDTGTGCAVAPNGQFVYGTDGNTTKGIHAYFLNAAGALTEIGGSPFAAGTAFGEVTITPDGKFLYATDGVTIQSFAISATGTLSSVGSPIPYTGAAFSQVSTDGRFLFVLSGSGNVIASFSIAANGSLTQNGLPLSVGTTFAGYFGVAPDASHLYVSDYNGNSVRTFSVAQDGALSFVTSVTSPRVRTLMVSPDGRFLYSGPGDMNELFVSVIGADGVPAAFTKVADWNSGEQERFVVRPIQPPTARLTLKAAAPGSASSFDATTSTAVGGTVTRYDWDFGDGSASPDGGPQAKHTYAKSGVYSVKVTAFDQGCGAQFVYNGQSTICAGGPSATATMSLDTPPSLKSLKFSPKKFKVASKGKKPKGGSKLKYTLSEKASVTFTVQHPTSGRLSGTRCKKKTKKNAKAKKCTLWVKDGKNLKQSGKAGANTLKFNGRPGSKALKPGNYRIYVVAVDSEGGKSAAATANFKIKR